MKMKELETLPKRDWTSSLILTKHEAGVCLRWLREGRLQCTFTTPARILDAGVVEMLLTFKTSGALEAFVRRCERLSGISLPIRT